MYKGILNTVSYDETTGMATFTFVCPSEYRTQADAFFKVYSIDKFIPVVGDEPNELKRNSERVCRFCKKSYPDVKFKTAAHLIPEFLGNKSLFSDFECDSCNHEFGSIERHFANFLGAKRTLSMQRAKRNRIPTSISFDGKVTIQEAEPGILKFNDEVFENQSKSENDDTEKILEFDHVTLPYCPLKVYKALLKIGLSLVKENEMDELINAINFLNDPSRLYNNTLISLHQYEIPGPHSNFPLLLAFKKRNDINDDTIPPRTVVLYFNTLMIQFFIPFHPNDEKVNQPFTPVTAHILPPLVEQSWVDTFGKPSSSRINLNSIEEETRTDHIKIKYQPKNM